MMSALNIEAPKHLFMAQPFRPPSNRFRQLNMLSLQMLGRWCPGIETRNGFRH